MTRKGHFPRPGESDPYACNVEAKKEGEQTRQFRCSSSPLSVSLPRPLSATVNVILVIRHKERRGYGAVEVGGVGGGVRADCPFAFRIVPDIVRAKKAKVPLVVKLQEVVEDEKEDREQDHPQHGEVEGSHLTPESAGVDGEAFAPGPSSCPRGPLDFTSLGQDVSNPENCFRICSILMPQVLPGWLIFCTAKRFWNIKSFIVIPPF